MSNKVKLNNFRKQKLIDEFRTPFCQFDITYFCLLHPVFSLILHILCQTFMKKCIECPRCNFLTLTIYLNKQYKKLLKIREYCIRVVVSLEFQQQRQKFDKSVEEHTVARMVQNFVDVNKLFAIVI